MGWFKQLHMCLSWTILSAICVSCQDRELTSTLRNGNHACEGEEVVFNCAVRDSSGLQILVLAWSSDEYIGSGDLLQFTTESMLGTNDTSTIDGNVTATLTRNTIDNGVRILESTLRLVAVQASVVTCDVTSIGQVSTAFLISAVPKAPLNVEAAEVSNRDECIILVQWDPPINRVESNLDHYLVYVPSRNIMENESSAISVLQVPSCGNNIHIQVAAVNRFGCIGPNVDVLPRLLDRRTATTEGGSASTSNKPTATTEDGSTSSQLDVGATIGIVIAAIVLTFCITFGIFLCAICKCGSKGKRGANENLPPQNQNEIQHHQEEERFKGNTFELYSALSRKIVADSELVAKSDILGATELLLAGLKELSDFIIMEAVVNSLEMLKWEEHKNMQRALEKLMEIVPDACMSSTLKKTVEDLKDKLSATSDDDIALGDLIEQVKKTAPKRIREILQELCIKLYEKVSSEREEVVNAFKISSEYLREIEGLLTTEFVNGLDREGDDVKVKMLVTHVHSLPRGKEEGDFLVVDLEGKYLLVLHVEIRGKTINPKSKRFTIEQELKTTSQQILFDFIAESVAEFVEENKITERLPVGFTFSFPVKQQSLKSGKLICWTKGYKVTGVDDKDVVQLLEEAFERKEVNVDVVALVNDTTAALLAAGNEVPDCNVGLILGEGTNACYMESLAAVPKFNGDRGHVIISTEWGAFGDDGKHGNWRTHYDCTLDDGSVNCGQYLFEKAISGKYLGEIVRLVLKDLIDKGLLFRRKSSSKLDEAWTFELKYVSFIENGNVSECKSFFKNSFSIKASDKDCEVVRRVCEAVSTRAARLTAAGVVALVKKIDKISGCTVAVDGGVYKQHPYFADRMKDAMNELAPGNKIKMMLTSDGPARGTALAAAIACRQAAEESKSPIRAERQQHAGQSSIS